MDVFKFINPTHPTLFDQGQLINGLKTKLWIERYRDISDFEFTANVETMVHKLLPIGTLVSHIETSEVMIVENHEIIEDIGKETEVKITGRSFEAFLENRIVGSNKAWPTIASATTEYLLAAGYTWNQAVQLIKDHIYLSNVIDPNDAILNVTVLTNVLGVSESVERSIKRGSVYTRLIEILDIDNLGIKTVRPGINSIFDPENTNMAIVIHKGEDLTGSIAFSYATGEIESADYLWSNKNLKNSALVTGRWIETVVKNGSIGYDRRMMYVDAYDIDSGYSVAPAGVDRTNVLAAMTVRGQAALAAQKEILFIKTEPTRDSKVYRYRRDYNVGDIVTVAGVYNEITAMQISEYVEIEDELNQSGYPTLSAI